MDVLTVIGEDWTEQAHRRVAEYGAVLVRGLDLRDADEFSRIARQLVTEVMPEREGFAPRTSYLDGVYSSSKWPADQPMCMHHELSYALDVPKLMLMACFVAPRQGGVTAVADSHDVLAALPADLVERFERDGWLLTRNYNGEVGVPWPEAFGTADRDEVEKYCAANEIEFDWQPDGGLRTRQHRSAVIGHPVTGRRSWFNQIAFLNGWTMQPAVREYLTMVLGEDGLPFDTRYGDGAPIDADTVRVINETYEANTRREPWRTGDLLLLDNIRMAHSREPYRGEREIAVVLADPTGR